MRLCLIALCLLAACNTPGRGFGGLPVVKLAEGGSTFDMRRSGNSVEVIRTSSHAFPRYDTIAKRAVIAVTGATGCDVKRITGDPSVMRMDLSC